MEVGMTIILKPEHEAVLADAVRSGIATSPEDALDRAVEALRDRLARATADETTAEVTQRLSTFGRRHGLSLGRLTVKDLLRESRA
jgi:hypothetical protein